jgi:hypothetical protein
MFPPTTLQFLVPAINTTKFMVEIAFSAPLVKNIRQLTMFMGHPEEAVVLATIVVGLSWLFCCI